MGTWEGLEVSEGLLYETDRTPPSFAFARLRSSDASHQHRPWSSLRYRYVMTSYYPHVLPTHPLLFAQSPSRSSFCSRKSGGTDRPTLAIYGNPLPVENLMDPEFHCHRNGRDPFCSCMWKIDYHTRPQRKWNWALGHQHNCPSQIWLDGNRRRPAPDVVIALHTISLDGCRQSIEHN